MTFGNEYVDIPKKESRTPHNTASYCNF